MKRRAAAQRGVSAVKKGNRLTIDFYVGLESLIRAKKMDRGVLRPLTMLEMADRLGVSSRAVADHANLSREEISRRARLAQSIRQKEKMEARRKLTPRVVRLIQRLSKMKVGLRGKKRALTPKEIRERLEAQGIELSKHSIYLVRREMGLTKPVKKRASPNTLKKYEVFTTEEPPRNLTPAEAETVRAFTILFAKMAKVPRQKEIAEFLALSKGEEKPVTAQTIQKTLKRALAKYEAALKE